jgi:hypothetical protein
VRLSLLVLRPLLAYCTSPRWQVLVIVEKLVEWRLAGETEVLWENLSQRHFVHHKPHMTIPGFEPGPPRWEASDQPLELWRGLLAQVSQALIIYEACCLPSCNAAYFWESLTFRRDISPPSSGPRKKTKQETSNKQTACLLLVSCLTYHSVLK